MMNEKLGEGEGVMNAHMIENGTCEEKEAFKKGDIIREYFKLTPENPIAYNFTNADLAHNFMTSSFSKFYKLEQVRSNIPYKIVPNKAGHVNIYVREEIIHYKDYVVNWIIGNELGITDEDGGSSIVLLNEHSFKLVKSTTDSFQESVAGMSDEELRASLQALREGRIITPEKPKRVKATAVEEDESEDDTKPRAIRAGKIKLDPMEVLLNSLPPEKREELKKKLGLV